MPLRLSKPDDVFTTGNYTIGLNFSLNALQINIIDSNPNFREARIAGKHMKQIEQRHWKRKKACLFGKEFFCIIESEGLLATDIVCPPDPVPEPCPPDPCAPASQSELNAQIERERLESFSSVKTAKGLSEPDECPEPPETDIPVGTFAPNEVKVWGFGAMGGIERSRFHNVIYRFEVPLAEFKGRFNIFEIYEKVDTNTSARLLSTPIEMFDTIDEEEDDDELEIEDVKLLIDEKIEPKADKSQIDEVNGRIDMLEEQQINREEIDQVITNRIEPKADKSQVDELSNRLDGLNDTINGLNSRIDELNEKIDRCINDYNELRSSTEASQKGGSRGKSQ